VILGKGVIENFLIYLSFPEVYSDTFDHIQLQIMSHEADLNTGIPLVTQLIELVEE
jgi:hypothetical protein